MGIFESNEKTVRDEIMKFKLLIDEDLEEEIIVIANKQTELTEQIKDLVNNYSKTFNVIGYREDEMRKLSFQDIECITILDRKVIDEVVKKPKKFQNKFQKKEIERKKLEKEKAKKAEERKSKTTLLHRKQQKGIEINNRCNKRI